MEPDPPFAPIARAMAMCRHGERYDQALVQLATTWAYGEGGDASLGNPKSARPATSLGITPPADWRERASAVASAYDLGGPDAVRALIAQGDP